MENTEAQEDDITGVEVIIALMTIYGVVDPQGDWAETWIIGLDDDDWTNFMAEAQEVVNGLSIDTASRTTEAVKQ